MSDRGQSTACAGGTTRHTATYTGAPSQFRCMASATLTRTRPGQPEAPARRRRSVSWPALALAGLIIGTTVGFFARPTFPNYDSYYSLLWGREVLHGTLPSFDAYRAPTEHPLAIAFGALLALVGDDADRIMVGATFASFVVLAAGMYRLAAASLHAVVGLVAAALLCTRFDFPFLAARGVHRHPVPRADRLGGRARGRAPAPRHARLRAARRGRAAAPGGMAAERAVLAVVLPAARPGRSASAYAALTADRPGRLVPRWTGSSRATRCSRSPTRPASPRSSGAPAACRRSRPRRSSSSRASTRSPVFYAGSSASCSRSCSSRGASAGRSGCSSSGWRRSCSSGLAGLSVIDRYLLVPSLMVMIFAAVTLGGWTMLRAGTAADRVGGRRGRGGRLRRGLHGDARQLRRLRQRARVPRPVARLARGAVPQPEGPRRAEVRAGVGAQPQARPGHALGARRGRRRRDRAQRPEARRARIGRGVAVYATSRRRSCARASRRTTRRPRTSQNSLPMPGFTWVAATADYGPMSAVESAPSRAARASGEGARAGPAAPARPAPAAGRGRRWPYWLALAVILAVALGLRLWGVAQGLPYAYNADENAHFVPGAIGLFGHGLNPHYFVNPPAYTYLLHVVFGVWFGGRAGVSNTYAVHPTEVLRRRARHRRGRRDARRVARVPRRRAPVSTAASACWPRRCWRSRSCRSSTRTSRSTTSPTLAPDRAVAVGHGRRPAHAGACATTRSPASASGCRARRSTRAGIVLLPLLAAGVDLRRAAGRGAASGRRPRAIAFGGLVLAGAARARRVRRRQPVLGPRLRRVPRRPQPPGLGRRGRARQARPDAALGPALLPVDVHVGPRLGPARRRRPRRRSGCSSWNRRLALVLVPAPILYVLFMGTQERFFGRWLLPVFPILCLLAAWAVVARRRGAHPRARRRVAPGARTSLGAVLAARPGARLLAARRARPVARRHAQPRARMDGRERARRGRRSSSSRSSPTPGRSDVGRPYAGDVQRRALDQVPDEPLEHRQRRRHGSPARGAS